jgi:predicted acyltransferase
VGRSGWAIAAGYLGLISVLLLPAPLAVLCGILAIRDIKKHPDRHGMGRAIFGLVLGGLGTILLVAMLVGLMIAGIKGR